VVVFTSSESPADIATAYGLGASCYVIKPLSLNDLEARIRGIATFLLRTARLPGRSRAAT